MTETTLCVREGGWYRRRDGEIVGPVRRSGPSAADGWLWYVSGHLYRSGGTWSISSRPHEFDLVEEVQAPVSVSTDADEKPAAYSSVRLPPYTDETLIVPSDVMVTRRDQFAMAALQGILAAVDHEDMERFSRAGLTDEQRCERFARAAFMIADAMEAARKGGA